MLDPLDRQHLLDALRPDAGDVLDAAVGTSFTLDLEAMLLAPLAFALFDVDGTPDPIALLAAIERHAGRIALYCDKAHIKAPAADRKLLVLLEPALLPVLAPRGGAFHPKLWVLRFRGPTGVLRHRVLVLSRNLTHDTSWDLLVQLDEDDAGRPLGGDVAGALLALDRLARSRVARDVAATVRSARFAAPKPFDELALHLTGTTARGPAHDPIVGRRGERLLAVSPFLSEPRLAELGALADRDRRLVSRAAELDRVGARALAGWRTPLVLHDAAVDPLDGDSEHADGRDAAAGAALRGLHAKLVVVDQGDRSTWFAGSMNATTSAVQRNVEACLELTGPRSRVGVAALLSEAGGDLRFRKLLREYPVEDGDGVEPTPEELERDRLDKLGVQLARMAFSVHVGALPTPGHALELRLTGDRPDLLASDRVEARAITRSQWRPVQIGATPIATLEVARVSEITSLVALRLTGRHGVSHELVLFGKLEGAPADRIDQLLLDLVPDGRRFALLLLLMLGAGTPDGDVAALARELSHDSQAGPASDRQDIAIPLYESLVRASAREPERLVAIDKLVKRLIRTEAGRERLPDGFAELWQSFADVVAEARR